MFIFKGTNLKFKSLTQLDSLCKGHWTVNVTRVTMRIVPMAPQIFKLQGVYLSDDPECFEIHIAACAQGLPSGCSLPVSEQGRNTKTGLFLGDTGLRWWIFCLMDSRAALCNFSENWLHGSLRCCHAHSPSFLLYFLEIRLASWSWLISPRFILSSFHRLLPFEISF